MRKFSRCWAPHFLSPAQKVAGVEASKAMLRVLQGAESNGFERIAADNESWFRYCYPFSTMYARAPSEVISRTRQIIGARKPMITIFFTAGQLILLDTPPRGSKFNQQYFIDHVFPDLEMENRNFRPRMPFATFGCTWIIQCVLVGQKSCQNSTGITLHDCRTHPIRQT
jgi:hypothetical protein